MAIVAGIVFFFIRAGLALIPSMASRYPIKKWAAAAALAAATFYLLLSGAEVATQRSFIMIAIVLAGIMVDRPTLTFRTITVAALGVLLLSPESVVNPSFQMSFAATLALIAAYQHGLPWRATADTSRGARIALWGGREIVGLILASFVAGLGTTPYAAYHFHRTAPYGVIANLLAMPVVSVEVMPMGILGVLAMPFGFDAIFWKLMGYGITWMDTVALWVTSLPGAVGRVRAFGTGPLLLATAAILLVCLLRTPLRWSGAVLALIAGLWAVATPLPDILVPGTARPQPFGGTVAGSRCCTATATASPSRSGLPPTVMHAPSRTRLCGMALRAMPSAASAGSATAGRCRRLCRSKPSPRIARAPPWWSARARRSAIAPPF